MDSTGWGLSRERAFHMVCIRAESLHLVGLCFDRPIQRASRPHASFHDANTKRLIDVQCIHVKIGAVCVIFRRS
jgi:hypothetical protein